MKKLLSVLLTLAMLLGCCTFVVAADEAAADTSILVDDLLTNKGTTQSYLCKGAAWNATYELFDSGVDTYLVYKINVPAGEGAVATVDFMDWTDIGNGGVHQYSDLPKYLCYVTSKDPGADFDGNVEEWTAVGANEEISMDTFTYTYTVRGATGFGDAKELYVCFKFASNDESHKDKAGWNDGAWVEKIAFDAVPFTGVAVYNGADNDAWTTGQAHVMTNEETGETNECRDFTLAAGSYDVADMTACLNLADKGLSYDVSEMDFLRFDIYIQDKMKISDTEFCIELTSSGVFDEQEHQYVGTFGGMGDGWNTISIRLGSFQNKEMDKTNFNFFRMYNNTAFSSESDFVFMIDNIRFEKEVQTGGDDYDGPVEEYMFFVLDGDTEEEFLVRSTSSQSGAAFRFCDTDKEIIYKFPITNRQNADQVLFTATVSQQVLLQVSHDGSSWKDIYRYEFDEAGLPQQGDPKKQITYDLTPLVDLNKYSDIYIRVGDAYPSNGWGTCIHSDQATKLEVRYTELTPEEWDAIEGAPDERSISLLTGSKGFGSFKPDTENKTNGYSSLMMTIAEGNVTQTTFDAIDSTGYDALEFDMYVTDPALFEATFSDTGIELSSQGKCDDGEICWRFADIAASEIKAGWNHVTLLFRDAKPDDRNAVEFDPTAINFFRLFFVGTPAEYVGGTFGIDNVRLTTAAAELDAAQAAADQEAADKVIKLINKIGEVTTKSERAIERAQSEYDELTDAQKALVTNIDVLTAAAAKYDELVNGGNEPAPDDGEDPEPDDGEGEDTGDGEGEGEDTDDGNDGNDDGETPDDKPADKGGMGALIIIIVVAVVVIAGAVVAIILIKKKKK